MKRLSISFLILASLSSSLFAYPACPAGTILEYDYSNVSVDIVLGSNNVSYFDAKNLPYIECTGVGKYDYGRSYVYSDLYWDSSSTRGTRTRTFYKIVSSCLNGQVPDAKGVCSAPTSPTCADNQILDNVSNSCVYPSLLNTQVYKATDPLMHWVSYSYSGGISQHCSFIDNSCFTVSPGGTHIPNIPIDGVAYITPGDMSVNRFITVSGTTLALTAGGILAVSTGGLATPAISATLGTVGIVSGLTVGGSTFNGTPFVVNPESVTSGEPGSLSQPIKINLATIDTTQSDSTVQTTYKQDTDEWLNYVSTPEKDTTIKTNDTTITLVDTFQDGTSESYSIPLTSLTAPIVQDDFLSPTNQVSPVVTKTTTSPQIYNSDGTITPPSTSSSSLTTNSETAISSPASASASSVDSASISAVSPDTIDYKPITDRLNQIINQNTLTNDTLFNSTTDIKSKLDSLIVNSDKNLVKLDDIKDAITDINLSVDTSNIEDSLNNIKDGLSTLTDGKEDDNGISSLVSSYNNQFTDFGNNIIGQYDLVREQVDELKLTLEGGFTNNLPTATVSSCSYTKIISFPGGDIPFSMDVCKVLVPLYSTFYFLFYLVFFAGFLSFAFHILISDKGN
jgi:hypothetical protein